jgi:hypothetical protein
VTLNIYDSTTGEPFSVDETFSNPFVATFDGRAGGSYEKLLYVRNSDITYEYSNITLTVEQLSGAIDLINGTRGFSFKLHEGDTQPTTEEWASINVANEIDIPDLDDIVTFAPFWIRLEVPRNVPVQRFRGVSLKLVADQTVA